MLLDSNVVIAAFGPARPDLRQLVADRDPPVSAATYVEVLGYHKLTADDRRELEDFFAGSVILPLTPDVLDRAVALRQARKMGLGDAPIAATALIHGHALATGNVKDFDWIDGLTVWDPFAGGPPPG